MSVDWVQLFDKAWRVAGASDAELALLVEQIGMPLSADEVAEVNAGQRNPFPPTDPLHASYRPFDPSRWVIPRRPLPPSYLAFLRWSNGGEFRAGERELGFLCASEVREYLLAYHFPQYMPGAVPFALDGGGVFYVFDLREPPLAGEYPILVTAAGNLGYEDALLVARSFVEVCQGRAKVGRSLRGEP